MKRLLAVVVALGALAVAAPTANAENIGDAKFQGSIHVTGKTTASLRVRYSCATGEHLWVSAKQSKGGRKRAVLQKEGSSKVSWAWWQSHRDTFTCDGQRHSATFSIDKVEKGSKGKLRAGFAWVQFCVTVGDGGPDSQLTVSKSGWVPVKTK